MPSGNSARSGEAVVGKRGQGQKQRWRGAMPLEELERRVVELVPRRDMNVSQWIHVRAHGRREVEFGVCVFKTGLGVEFCTYGAAEDVLAAVAELFGKRGGV